MELDELEARLLPFAKAQYGDVDLQVYGVHKMPGHAGFSYGFSVRSRGEEESWFLRLPPPGAKWEGTADVMRQVAVLRALDGTDVPHCPVKWAGEEGADLEWFGCPYFVVPCLEGDVVRTEPGEWTPALPKKTRWDMARQSMSALAALHRIPYEALVPRLGEPIPFDVDVKRWDRFEGRMARPEDFARLPSLRQKLLDRAPEDAAVGVFHGDFQFANNFYSFEGELLAVIDWELTGIGATLNDVGWVATFNDAAAWTHDGFLKPTDVMPDAEELCAMYEAAWGEPLRDVAWFRALAGYKFAVITGLNLGLHRRGQARRPRPGKIIGDSIPTLLARSEELLRSRSGQAVGLARPCGSSPASNSPAVEVVEPSRTIPPPRISKIPVSRDVRSASQRGAWGSRKRSFITTLPYGDLLYASRSTGYPRTAAPTTTRGVLTDARRFGPRSLLAHR